MKPEQLKSLSLTEDVISALLQLIDKELKERNRAPCPVPLDVQVAACIVSVFGWSASLVHQSAKLPVLSCSYCMRKVGLWNFHQMEWMAGDGEASANSDSPATQAAGAVSAPAEVPGDISVTASPSCRMKLRSQDSTRPDLGEAAALSLLTRGKRPATRSRGLGDDPGAMQQSSKRLCLSSFDNTDCPLQKEAFNPISQHRDWCPWITVEKENLDPNAVSEGESPAHQCGWKAVLDLLMPVSADVGTTPVQGPRDKSKKMFAIFHQWQVSAESL